MCESVNVCLVSQIWYIQMPFFSHLLVQNVPRLKAHSGSEQQIRFIDSACVFSHLIVRYLKAGDAK